MKAAWLPLLLCAACGAPELPPVEPLPLAPPGPVEAETQRDGDPLLGRLALLETGYVGCGLPEDIYRHLGNAAPRGPPLPGREGRNAQLPFFYTAMTSSRGVPVITANCLYCHGEDLAGTVTVGMGRISADFTVDLGRQAQGLGALVWEPNARADWQHWSSRVGAVMRHARTRVVGTNPGDAIAAAVFAYRDPLTLAWLGEPQFELAEFPAAVDVPPLWNTRFKNALFHPAAGRGDHARIMMTASLMCTESVAEARALDAQFPHVRAYLQTLRPPPWPRDLNLGAVSRGRAIFRRDCVACHGTHDPTDTAFPNLVVALEEVGTDAALITADQFSPASRRWFSSSFMGETSRLEPAAGYLAPPLFGIWASAPYLHNGSVPTLQGVLHSPSRPKYWRSSRRLSDYDDDEVGLKHETLNHGHSGEPIPSRRAQIYDTTLPTHGNAGHTFGDVLTQRQRMDLLEYLKTL